MKTPVAFLLSLLAVAFTAAGQDDRFLFKGLPAINITLLDNKTEADINQDVKFNANMSVANAYGSTFTALQLFTGNITIKGRGNSTWLNPKRPYNIVTCDTAFQKKNVPIFGFPTHSAWCLLAEYEDRTDIRTLFTNTMSYSLGLPWASRGLKVELYMNGEYRGLYTFCEKVERGVNRINIKDLNITDNSGTALTGGYTMEKQAGFQVRIGEAYFIDNTGSYYSYKVPDSDKVTPQQNSYMKDYWNNFLDKLYNQPFSDTVNGYRSVINPLSFAQYFLLEDISKNGDAYSASWYTTKDRLKKMDAGPGWDWGLTWGQHYVANYGHVMSDPNDTYVAAACPYYDKMMQDTFFSNLVKRTFASARVKINQLIADGEAYYPQLVATGAIARNMARWPYTYPYGLSYFPTYQQNIDFFFAFVKQRIYFQTRNIYGLQLARPTHADIY